MYEPQTNLPKVVRRIAKKKSFNEPQTKGARRVRGITKKVIE